MNKWLGIGNLTKDPELSKTPNGTSVCKFTIAINRIHANANGDRDCDYINIVAWQNLAENCARFLVKGKKVAVVGSLQIRSYQSGNETKYVTEIIADSVEFLSPKDDESAPVEKSQNRPAANVADDNDDDFPF